VLFAPHTGAGKSESGIAPKVAPFAGNVVCAATLPMPMPSIAAIANADTALLISFLTEDFLCIFPPQGFSINSETVDYQEFSDNLCVFL
jgi:hypothetical protein